MDWVRKAMQLSVVATVALGAYVLYGFMFGEVGNWSSLTPDNRARLLNNITGAIFWFNISFSVMMLTICILYYDEETLGYVLIAAGVFCYYGVPFMFSMMSLGTLEEWNRTRNLPALAAYNEIMMLGLILAIPGGILTIRDIILRLADGSRRKREEFTALQYGGSVKEEKEVSPALIGVFAKCWQMSYCREAIRKRCPIFHARTRCWKQRVGCMCEENVIRKAMDSLINKEDMDLIKKEEPVNASVGGLPPQKTEEMPRREIVRDIAPKDVKIPHNPNLTSAQKKERCRNCVIYNEHQRLKYQFLSPLVIIIIPLVCFIYFEQIQTGLNSLLSGADRIMANLSLGANPASLSLTSSVSSAAQYIILACLMVIALTWTLRFLEYVVFKLKI
jgi:hypothetical protein